MSKQRRGLHVDRDAILRARDRAWLRRAEGEVVMDRRPHWDDELVDAAFSAFAANRYLIAAEEPSGFYALIAAVEDWHKAKRDQRDRTHSTECWRWHQECAEDMIETLRAQVQVVRECAELRLGIPVVDGTYQTGYAAAMADILRILDTRGSA